MPQMKQTALPRWRGFNLLEMFTCRSDGNWQEDDFRWISDWGFDFVRLPLCYLLWCADNDPFTLREDMLGKLDRAVALGDKHKLHVCLNFHRAPGYSVNSEREEPFVLWRDDKALDAFCFHWAAMARRYRGIPSSKLSFNLVNEPPAPRDTVDWDTHMSLADHERVIRKAAECIRSVDPQRLIMADGTTWGLDARPEIADMGLALACRGYYPMGTAFSGAFDSKFCKFWLGTDEWPEPCWPGGLQKGVAWDRRTLDAYYDVWSGIAAAKGAGLVCGECGGFNKTPHRVFLAWFRDALASLTERNIGYALWNFRGAFGVLDSKRADVKYADWRGHALDSELLALLRDF